MVIYTTLEQAIKTTQRNKGTVWFGHSNGISAQLFRLVAGVTGVSWLGQKVSGEVYEIPEDAEIVWSSDNEYLAKRYMEMNNGQPK